MLTLYHGTDIFSAKDICDGNIDISKSSKRTDFGQGFYTTDDFERAAQWAYRKAILRRAHAAVVTVIFDDESANSIIERFSDDLRWGRFIMNNRNGLSYINQVSFKENNLDARYAITYGRIADIDIRKIAEKLNRSGKLLASIEGILNEDYPIQIAFHTDESLKYIVKTTYRSL